MPRLNADRLRGLAGIRSCIHTAREYWTIVQHVRTGQAAPGSSCTSRQRRAPELKPVCGCTSPCATGCCGAWDGTADPAAQPLSISRCEVLLSCSHRTRQPRQHSRSPYRNKPRGGYRLHKPHRCTGKVWTRNDRQRRKPCTLACKRASRLHAAGSFSKAYRHLLLSKRSR